jgi:hypothetical protein
MSYTVIITEEDTANITVDETTQNITVDTSSFPITIEYNATILTPNASPYGNAEVVALMAAFGSNAISTTGNITTGNVIGNGSGLSAITGANVTGTVANATFALTANTATFANSATIANSANSVAGANVTGTVANATYALNANTASFANTATVANSANAVTGANVSGTVANATYALNANTASFANTATIANSANAVAGANVSGTVANATYAANAGSATTATTAGTVTDAAQANITSVGTLSSLSVTGNVAAGGVLTDNYRYANGTPISFAGTYGDANVVGLMGAFGSNAISTSGNVTAGNITVTADAVVQGNLTVSGNTTFINSNVVTINDKFINVANNAATAASANGGGIGVGPAGTEYATLEYLSTPNVWATNIGVSVTGNVAAANVNTAGAVSATGNVTGAYIQGNGSLLSNITGANVTGTVANATFATSSGSATTAATVTGAAQANITSVGTLTGLSVSGNTTSGNVLTAGTISATGNVSGNYILGNGSQLTGLPATYGNADVVSLLAAFGSNSISTTGNVTASYVIGNGSLLTNITGANVTGVVANATYAASAGSAGSANTAVTVTGNAQANITSVGVLTSLSVTGNVDSGNILTAGIVSATSNITGNYILGNGSQLTGITTSAGGSNTQIQFNDGGVFAGNVAMTFNNTTGRVQLGNITTTGSIINTANTWTDTTAASTAPSTIIIGNGYSGNYSTTYLTNNQRNTRLSLMDLLTATDNGARKTELASTVYYDLNGVTTYGNANVNSRLQGITSEVFIQNGNTVQSSPLLARSAAISLSAGQSANVGNANLATASSIVSFVAVSNGSRIGNAYGIYSGSSGNTAQGALMPTAMLFVAAPNHQPGSGAVDVGNIFNYYTPGSVNTFGISSGNTTRVANYWNIYNEDNANKNRLGALTQYQESSYSLSSSAGAVVVNKANSQVQYYTVSEAATMSFTGFITVANIPTGGGVPTAVNRYQTDTVTVIVQQDSTGRTITMPSGTGYKYAAGVSTVPATANAISMISITAYYDPGTSATAYLTTISPAFT